MHHYFGILATCLLLFCVSCKDDTSRLELYPSDYLFAQRSFPSGTIDLKAYQQALLERGTYSFNKEDAFNGAWVFRGPENISGRVSDIEIDSQNPNIIYTATASGGILKSTDHGMSWTPIFDDASSLSIGDIALYRNNPEIIYAGTGESNAGGGSIAYDGNGVYKSINGGLSWTHLGPNNIGSIGRVIIHPENPDIVYVAGMGHLFQNNPERGIFKTENGGASWQHILSVSDSTGGIDLAIHPKNPDTIYAAMWERVRRVHKLHYGGSTSNIYRSYDGGASWHLLEDGLPSEASEKGRIGLAISESEPNILYAYYANAKGALQGIYRSQNHGDTWESQSIVNINNVAYTYWFGKIFVDPVNSDKVIVTSLNLFASDDGARSWERIFSNAHVDHHAIAFHPGDTSAIVNGNDGGVNISTDYGRNSVASSGLNNIQFYSCEIDPNNPNVLYGGTQDNGTLKTDSLPHEWRQILGGDGFRVIVDPNNSKQLYCEAQYGNIYGSTNGGQTIYYAQQGLTGNFNWNTPIAMDPNNSQRIYTGSQLLFRSDSMGHVWQPISGLLVDSDNPGGNLIYGSISAIDVSALNSDIIYIGTDNGKLWVTTDGGFVYNDVSLGIPERWISSLAHDPFLESGIFVTVSGFRFGEFESHVFYSPDYGQNWTAIGRQLPDVPVNDILIDDHLKDHIYVATDIGIFYTTDFGMSWQLLGNNVPIVPILDLDLHPASRTLVAASYGRGLLSYSLPLQTSVKENLYLRAVSIFPNPASDFLNIDTELTITDLSIFDLSGQSMGSRPVRSTLDISDLKPGIYVLRLSSYEHTSTLKFLKI